MFSVLLPYSFLGKGHSPLLLALFFFFFFWFFGAALKAYGGSQARGRIGTAATSLHRSHRPTPQPQQVRSAFVTYTTAHGNAGSLTHWARPGDWTCTLMDTSQIRFCRATMGTPGSTFLYLTGVGINLLNLIRYEWESLEQTWRKDITKIYMYIYVYTYKRN